MENFTKKNWRITSVDPKTNEKEGHTIKIDGTEAPNDARVTCLDDRDHHTYLPGTYHAGPPEMISGGGDSYAITLIPGEPHNQIEYVDLKANAGSWTADDSISPAGDE